jgi:tripartite-type tricarboxylate transporter receptor subunit TctC
MIVVNKDFPANTLGELIAYARANPGKLNFGSPSVGSQTTIGSEILAQMAGIDVVAVPYRGTGPAFNDLLGGTLGFFVNTSQQLIGPLQGHLIKGLAIMSPKRHPQLPDLPTTAEARSIPGMRSMRLPARRRTSSTYSETRSKRSPIAPISGPASSRPAPRCTTWAPTS